MEKAYLTLICVTTSSDNQENSSSALPTPQKPCCLPSITETAFPRPADLKEKGLGVLWSDWK